MRVTKKREKTSSAHVLSRRHHPSPLLSHVGQSSVDCVGGRTHPTPPLLWCAFKPLLGSLDFFIEIRQSGDGGSWWR